MEDIYAQPAQPVRSSLVLTSAIDLGCVLRASTFRAWELENVSGWVLGFYVADKRLQQNPQLHHSKLTCMQRPVPGLPFAGRSLGIRQHLTDRPTAVGLLKSAFAAEPSRRPVARGTSAVHAGKATLGS